MKSMAQLKATTKSPGRRRGKGVATGATGAEARLNENDSACRANERQEQHQRQRCANESGNVARAALTRLLASPLLAPIVGLFSGPIARLAGASLGLICLFSTGRRRQPGTKRELATTHSWSSTGSFFEHLGGISTKMASGFRGQPTSYDHCDGLAGQQEQSSIVTVTSKFSRLKINSRPATNELEFADKRDDKSDCDGQSNRLTATTATEEEEAVRTNEQAGAARAPGQQRQQHQQMLPPTGQQPRERPQPEQQPTQQQPLALESTSRQMGELIIWEAMEKLHSQSEGLCEKLAAGKCEQEQRSLSAAESPVGGGRQVERAERGERLDICGQSIASRRQESENAGGNPASQQQAQGEEGSDVDESNDKQSVLAEEQHAQASVESELERKNVNHDAEQNRQMQPREGDSGRENAERETLLEAEGASADCRAAERVGGQVANGTFQAREAVAGHEHANFAQPRVPGESESEGKVRVVAATADLWQEDEREQSEAASAGCGVLPAAANTREDREDRSRRQQQQVAERAGEDLRTSDWQTVAKQEDEHERSQLQQQAVLAVSSSCSPDSSSSSSYKRQSATVSEVGSSEEDDDEMDLSSCAGSNSLDGCNRNATRVACKGLQQRDYPNGSEQLLEEQDDDQDAECCGEAASDLNLRKLKLNTFEDVLVCERNRESLEAARRLFGSLVVRQQELDCNEGDGEGRRDANHNLKSISSALKGGHQRQTGSAREQVAVSLPSGACVGGFERAEHGDDELGRVANLLSSPLEDDDENGFGGVKIVRSKSGGSSASSPNNFRQTLVCSVSPTSQLGGSSSDVSSTNNANNDTTSETIAGLAAPSGSHPLYPIDGDEIRQCRTAFRENKRLIQEQQDRASRAEARSNEHHSERSANVPSAWSRASSRQRDRFERDYKRQLSQSTCSRCQQRVYPVDKLELDFTRATLNIHRNCFKCQVCSSLLRLETYSAIDAKLYCPAHIKRVTSGR